MASHEDEVDQDGVLRSYSDSPPSHYSLKVNSYSLMTEYSVDGYGTEEFEAGGYEWKLVIYPSGNKKRNVTDHISLYLELAGEASFQSDCEVYVHFRFFLLDQKKSNYLVVEDAFAKKICFHRMMLRSPSFDMLMPLKEFTDASNGYLIEDTFVLGAEVFVCKEKTTGIREHLSKINDAFICKQVWKVEKFSNLTDGRYRSTPFRAGDQLWRIDIYPKRCGQGIGTDLSIFLTLADWKPIPPLSKIFVAFALRIADQSHAAEHQSWTGKHCFTAESPSWGFQFSSVSILEGKGLLMNDTCIVEAEVTVHGVSKVLY